MNFKVKLSAFPVLGLLVFMLVFSNCNPLRNSSPALSKDYPIKLQGMIEEIQYSFNKLKSKVLVGQDLQISRDARPSKIFRLKRIANLERQRLYYFYHGRSLWLVQSNDNGFFNEGFPKFSELYEFLGPEDLNLSTRINYKARELVYLKLGISLVAKPHQDHLYEIFVFRPMTEQQYKRLIWDDPSRYFDGLIY